MHRSMFRVIAKISKQIPGTRKLFEYKSSEANQLQLLYYITGKIYFTDKIQPLIKCIWMAINLIGVPAACLSALACLLQDADIDPRNFLDIAAAVGAATHVGVVLPGILYYYRRGIEMMIKGLDELPRSTCKKKIDGKTMLVYNFCIAFALTCVHNIAPILDVGLLYEMKKVTDHRYYVYPVPNIDENGSSEKFAWNCSLVVFNSPLYWFAWTAGISLISLWGVACHNQLMYIQAGLESRMDGLELRHWKGHPVDRSWNRAFDRILIQHIEAFKNVNRVVDNFRDFAQLFCSLVIPVNFIFQVVQLYLLICVNMPWSVRLKCISYLMAASGPMFLLYWVGEILENAVSAVSLSVYCTPWYRSIKVRSNVLIFLCQTQRTRNLFMWKVYPLVFRNYSRLIHSIASTVNILRRLV